MYLPWLFRILVDKQSASSHTSTRRRRDHKPVAGTISNLGVGEARGNSLVILKELHRIGRHYAVCGRDARPLHVTPVPNYSRNHLRHTILRSRQYRPKNLLPSLPFCCTDTAFVQKKKIYFFF